MSQPPDRLIVFTRYPEAGKAKTRLMPAVGAAAAALLQHLMTRHTLQQVDDLRRSGRAAIEVRYAGGCESAMRDLYGPHYSYRPQRDGDLGARLAEAAAAGFVEGCGRVVIVGTDCPDVRAAAVAGALDALAESDVAIGPAADGGYYLVALRRMAAPLFDGVPWGSGGVLAATLCIARRLGLGVRLLETLHDVDRPEDLPVWERAFAAAGDATAGARD